MLARVSGGKVGVVKFSRLVFNFGGLKNLAATLQHFSDGRFLEHLHRGRGLVPQLNVLRVEAVVQEVGVRRGLDGGRQFATRHVANSVKNLFGCRHRRRSRRRLPDSEGEREKDGFVVAHADVGPDDVIVDVGRRSDAVLTSVDGDEVLGCVVTHQDPVAPSRTSTTTSSIIQLSTA